MLDDERLGTTYMLDDDIVGGVPSHPSAVSVAELEAKMAAAAVPAPAWGRGRASGPPGIAGPAGIASPGLYLGRGGA